MADRDTRNRCARCLALSEHFGFEVSCVTPSVFDDSWESVLFIHNRCPLNNKWPPRLLSKALTNRWDYRPVTLNHYRKIICTTKSVDYEVELESIFELLSEGDDPVSPKKSHIKAYKKSIIFDGAAEVDFNRWQLIIL